jgi:hypothetical protein
MRARAAASARARAARAKQIHHAAFIHHYFYFHVQGTNPLCIVRRAGWSPAYFLKIICQAARGSGRSPN